MSAGRVLVIAFGTVTWLVSIVAVPTLVAWIAGLLGLGGFGARELWWGGTLLVMMVLTFAAVLAGIAYQERSAAAFLRKNGIRCTAYVKRYDRFGRSMTQQKVLFLIELPTGAIGRDYVMSNLDERWLADVCALNKPIRVIAHPDATTILFE